MKKFVLFCFSFVLAFSLATYLGLFNNSKNLNSKNAWITYSKSKNNKITHYNSTPEELHSAKISTNRSPASINEMKDSLEKVKRQNTRKIIGDFDITKAIKMDQISMSNSLSEDWRDALSFELLRFHSEDTKIIIKKEDSIVKIENGKGRLLEQVIISYLQDKHMLSSFRALVDSETGKIYETWDRTIHEKIGHHHDKEQVLTLTPYQDSGVDVSIK